MNPLSRILLTSIFLLIIAATPWLLLSQSQAGESLRWVVMGLEVLGLAWLILDLAVFGTISQTFGQMVNRQTADASFSLRRVAYLLFVYLTPISAVLGLMALMA